MYEKYYRLTFSNQHSEIHYRKWENNEVDFSLSQLGKIAKLYEISIQDIIIESGFKEAKVVSQKQKAHQYF